MRGLGLGLARDVVPTGVFVSWPVMLLDVSIPRCECSCCIPFASLLLCILNFAGGELMSIVLDVQNSIT